MDQLRNTAQGYIDQTVQNMQGIQGSGQLQQDEQGVNAQRGALQNMQNIAQQGFTPQDQATLASGQRQAALQEQAQRGAVMSQARQRGMGGSGTELMGALSAQQGAANRNADVAADLGQARLQRQFDATGAASTMGSNLAGQQNQFGQQNYENQMQNVAGLTSVQQAAATANQNAAQGILQRRMRRTQAVMQPIMQAGQAIMSMYGGGG